MRNPRNFDAQIRSLAERAKTLKARKVAQLGDVVMAVGAEDLEPEVVAGMLLAALDGMDEARRAEWRERGARFFRERRPRRAAQTARSDTPAPEQDAGPDAAR